MKRVLIRRFTEIGAYLHKLTGAQKRLLVTYFLYGLAAPLVLVYSSTYVWRNSHDILLLLQFLFMYPLGLSIGFWINGYALRKVSVGRMYVLGCLCIGAAPYILVSLPFAAPTIVFSGLFLGIAAGIYHGNRNMLTGMITVGADRYAFLSIESFLSSITNIISPILIGFFLAFGIRLGLGGAADVYGYATAIGFLLLILSGILAMSIRMKQMEHTHPKLSVPSSPLWKTLRHMEYWNGFLDGAEHIFPVLLILLFLGNEEIVGTVHTTVTLMAVTLLGVTAPFMKTKYYSNIIALWGLLFLISASILSVALGPVAVLIYLFLPTIIKPFRWAVFGTVMHNTIDASLKQHGGDRFSYLMRREFALNTGRGSGILLIIVLYITAGQMLMLQFGLLLAAFAFIPMILSMQTLITELD